MALLHQAYRYFGACERGSLIVTFALIIPILCVMVVGAAEYAEVLYSRAALQKIVDASALKGATEFGVDQSAATLERTRINADSMAEPLRLRWTVLSSAAL